MLIVYEHPLSPYAQQQDRAMPTGGDRAKCEDEGRRPVLCPGMDFMELPFDKTGKP